MCIRDRSVAVPKNLSGIKTKVALNLTKRQLICFSGAGAVGIPFYIFTKGFIGTQASALLMVAVMLPFFFLAMYEKDGFPAEKILYFMIRQKFLTPVSYTHLLLRLGEYRGYTEHLVGNNVYMDLDMLCRKIQFKRTHSPVERSEIQWKIQRYKNKLKPDYAGKVCLEIVQCVFSLPEGAAAVSYTHLDVYKRQQKKCLQNL